MVRTVGLILLSAISLVAEKPFDLDALLRIQRIAEPQLSPDGKWVAFSVQTIDLANNTRPRHLYVVAADGSTSPRKLTFEGSSNSRPRWTPDSKRILFHSNRGGSMQIWSIDPDGSDARAITSISTETEGLLVSKDGKRIVFRSQVYPECSAAGVFDDACNKQRIDAEAASKLKARVYTSLLYRHWNEFKGKRRYHLLVANIDGTGVRDLTPGSRDVPPFSLGGPDDYVISPDSSELAYTMNADPEPAVSTNSDIFVVALTGGEPKQITFGLGADKAPLYSPDGKAIAFLSQQRAGYESDRWRLALYDRAGLRETVLTETLDKNVNAITWLPDSQRLAIVVEDRGRHLLQIMPASGGGGRTIISGAVSVDDVQFSADAKTMIYSEMSGSKPVEIYRTGSSGGTPVALTKLNDALLSGYKLTPLEEIWVRGAEDARVHSFMVKPPAFESGRKYPVLFLIHGGPQGAWGESWSYRWNAQVFAGAGYVVVMPNPRGSTGYGQRFTDEINADWGGKVYEDIMAVVDHVAAQPWADADRMAAAGGSYGGYMANWVLGHTTRFKALVSHAGVFDLRSMAGETEELWFPLWEFRGMPWDNPEVYQRWSPSYYVRDFKTPTLVLHGELDYRVPVGQGMQLFTALQMMKVPSKMVLFPDEGHWILKPQNTELWYKTFLDWVGEWTRKPAVAN
jgi:dipeptidyl aminopeptidase/acylaminoacyl peptidase